MPISAASLSSAITSASYSPDFRTSSERSGSMPADLAILTRFASSRTGFGVKQTAERAKFSLSARSSPYSAYADFSKRRVSRALRKTAVLNLMSVPAARAMLEAASIFSRASGKAQPYFLAAHWGTSIVMPFGKERSSSKARRRILILSLTPNSSIAGARGSRSRSLFP